MLNVYEPWTGCAQRVTPIHKWHPSSADAQRLKSRHPFVPAAKQLSSLSGSYNIRAVHWADHQWNVEWMDKTLHFHSWHLQPPYDPPRTAWVWLNCLRTSVGHFRSCLYKWGMARNGFRECGALAHLSFWGPTQVWPIWPFEWKVWKYAPLVCSAPQNLSFVVPTLVPQLP